jgi:putative flippase GtrA
MASLQSLLQSTWRHAVVRYVVVGVANTGFSYAVYALGLLLGCSYAVASLISLIAGICLSFKTQGRFVFHNTRNSLFGRFVASWVLVYLINVGVIAVFVHLGFEPFAAGALALPFNVAAGFVLQRFFVFGGRGRPAPRHTEGEP